MKNIKTKLRRKTVLWRDILPYVQHKESCPSALWAESDDVKALEKCDCGLVYILAKAGHENAKCAVEEINAFYQ